MRLLTDAKPACGSSEQARHWTIGGELTSIQAGRGLVASEDDSTIALDVDTSLVQSRVGPGCLNGGAMTSIDADGAVGCTTT